MCTDNHPNIVGSRKKWKQNRFPLKKKKPDKINCTLWM